VLAEGNLAKRNHGVKKKNEISKKSRSRSARVSAALRAIAEADIKKNGIKKI